VWIALAILGGFSLGLRLPWTRTAMVLVLLHLALTHVRNQELLGIIGPLLIAAPLSAQLGSPVSARTGSAGKRAARGLAMAPFATAVIAAVLITLGFLSTAFEPSSAAAVLLDHLPGWQRVYSDDYAVVHRRNM